MAIESIEGENDDEVADAIAEGEEVWYGFHEPDPETGGWKAGIEMVNIEDHDKAVEMELFMIEAMREFVSRVTPTDKSKAH